jgi:hypothetical protein
MLPASEGERGRPRLNVRSISIRILLPVAVVLILPVAGPLLGLPEKPRETRRSEMVGPGVEHIEIRRGESSVGLGPDRWMINILVVDPSRTRLALGRANDKGVGTETTSAIVRRLSALAGINGGYFRTEGPYRGEPGGIFLTAGKVLSEPSRKRPGLAVSNKGSRTRAAIVDVAFQAEVVGGKNVKRGVDGINRPRLDDELILFTPEFDKSTLTGPNGAEAVIEKGRVSAVSDALGNAAIPSRGWVLSAHGAAARWLRANVKRGMRLEVKTDVRLSPRPGFTPEFIIGGGPRLVASGRPAAAADPGVYSPGFADARHPRTAVGVRLDGRILLVTVDGRQPEKSVGMTIAELTALLLELGAVEAINMDGGGSSTMAVRGRVVNSPSDLTGERPVGDALLLFRR